jgi:hypothetical protein
MPCSVNDPLRSVNDPVAWCENLQLLARWFGIRERLLSMPGKVMCSRFQLMPVLALWPKLKMPCTVNDLVAWCENYGY